jgi:hypothetical protein
VSEILSFLVVAALIAFLVWTLFQAISTRKYSFLVGNLLTHPVSIRRESHPTLFWLSAAVNVLTVLVLLVVLAEMLAA